MRNILLDNQKKGLDIKFSLKGKQIKEFREDINLAYNLLEKSFHRNVTENKSKIFEDQFLLLKILRKEIFIYKHRRIDQVLGLNRIFNKLINRKSPYNFNEGEPLKKSLIKKLNL